MKLLSLILIAVLAVLGLFGCARAEITTETVVQPECTVTAVPALQTCQMDCTKIHKKRKHYDDCVVTCFTGVGK